LAKVTGRSFETTGESCFICDFSPPRSGDPAAVIQADIPADFIAVAYNPGRAVRTNSAMLAASIKLQTGREVTFTLATRDMNKVALQSLLLGSQLLGLENVVVVEGDPFTRRDAGIVRHVGDFTPTELIAAATAMNEGVDFRGSRLRAPSDFCVGASLDLERDIEAEARLARRKVEAGAQFFITQPIFNTDRAQRFLDVYQSLAGEAMAEPVFYGLPILERDGVVFSHVPQQVIQDLERGRGGMEIALEQHQAYRDAGFHNVYVVPPIRRGGARNYGAAREFLAAVGRV
jgi:homocysteine S-methyltransferase